MKNGKKETKNKKNTKKTKSKDNKINSRALSEYNNLLSIFVGLFIGISLVFSSSMGLMGEVMQNVFKGLFGSLSILIPLVLIIVPLMPLIFKLLKVFGYSGNIDESDYVYKIKHNKLVYIAVIFIFIFYGLIYSELSPVDNPLRPEMISAIMKSAVEDGGIGLIPSIIIYYIKAIFGLVGGWLLSIFLLILSILFTFKISINDIVLMIQKRQPKLKEGEVNKDDNEKDKSKNLKTILLDMFTEEVDEDTLNKKRGFFDKLLNKNKNEDEEKQITSEENLDSSEEDDQKTIKIEGFEKYEDGYIGIVEGEENSDTKYKTQEIKVVDQDKEITEKQDTLKIFNKLNKEDVLSDKLEDTKKLYDEDYKRPPLSCLKSYSKSNLSAKEDKSEKVIETLNNFNIEIASCDMTHGPTITRYEVSPKAGTKVSKIVNLSDDLALSLAAQSIRIEAPVPGKSVVGIEVPNDNPQMVGLRDVLADEEFKDYPSCLAVGLGQDISGKAVVADLAKMPHLLIAGATGSGKSVCINTIITSLIYKSSPDDVKLLLIDPKVVELSNYNGIPHLISPVVTDTKKASNALNWAVSEMNKRYKAFADNSVKDINSYNKKIEAQNKAIEEGEQLGEAANLDKKEKMYKIVIIIDELADLMMACSNEVEDAICRLAQMARAAGIHLIIATQRPSVDVITGTIKANIPSRIAFAVSSQTDSRTILDMGGAEKLLGKGDMLYYPLGYAKPVRIQGAFISEEESENVIEYVKPNDKKEIKYDDEITEVISKVVLEEIKEEEDEFLQASIDYVMANGQASASMLQRKFKIGFNRAARLIDSMEERGIVGPSKGSKPREILITKEELDNMRNNA